MSDTFDLFEKNFDKARVGIANLQRARREDPATSHQAAARVDEFENKHYGVIVDALIRLGPATIYTIAARSGLDHVAVARRMPELAKFGKVRPTGRTESGVSGRACRIWEAT